MNYELFRSNIIADLDTMLDIETIEKIINKIDLIANKYDIRRKCTDIIVANQWMEVIKYYIASKTIQHLSRLTLYNYCNFLKTFFEVVHKNVEEITANDIRAFLWRYKQERNVTDSTMENKRTILHSFFLWCYEEGITKSNPCARVLPIKFQDNLRDPMDRDELELMRSVCNDPREKALVETMFSTGCRVSEIAELKLTDVDWQKRSVVIRHGKGDKKRVSYLNSKAVLALKNYLKTRTDNCDYLFVNTRVRDDLKHGIGRRSLEYAVRKIWERTGLTHKITPHVFRNTCGTLLSQSGMPIEQVQRLLGHANIKTTMRYVKVFDDDVKNSHQKYTA